MERWDSKFGNRMKKEKRMDFKISIIDLFFAFLCIFGFLNANPVKADWVIEGVDTPHRFDVTRRSIAVSTDGIVHIVYGGDKLYHAYNEVFGSYSPFLRQ